MPRLAASVLASTTGLAFWWGLSEPLPIPPPVLLGVAAAILFCSGVIAGRLGVLAAPIALAFSLLAGSILATKLHQAFAPSFAPVETFGGGVALTAPTLVPLLLGAAVIGALGGIVGERALASRARRD